MNRCQEPGVTLWPISRVEENRHPSPSGQLANNAKVPRNGFGGAFDAYRDHAENSVLIKPHASIVGDSFFHTANNNGPVVVIEDLSPEPAPGWRGHAQ